MTKHPQNYFRYFTTSPEIGRWGLGLTAAGFTAIPAATPYPPTAHPSDHQFAWERGRVLEALQIVSISRGRGHFESKATGKCAIEPGMAFVLIPKIWHRYRPDPGEGWVESWIEVQGPTVDRLLRSKVFSAASAVRRADPAAGLEATLDRVHFLARAANPGFDPELASAALSVLAAWEKAARLQPMRSRLIGAIAAAEHHFAEHLADPVNVATLASKLGIAYSHFRREFKAHTGFAPWQYVLHLRLSRARRLLSSSEVTLDDAAARLGFSSAFHLSCTFKRAFGVAPQHWRKELARNERRGK